jgi:hypothetical protein
MSYRFSYDLDTSSADSDDRSRIRLIFERFGWQATGGSSLRYPALGKQEQPDDLFGQVIPALSLFRSLVSARKINVKAYSWSAYAEADYRQEDGIGHAILPVSELQFVPSQQSDSTQNRMSENRMREALQAAEQALV